MKNLVLIGFMGAGKTVVGKRVASDLGMIFVDTDEVVAERFGMSVSEIFSRFGEPEFRKAEQEAVSDVSAGSSQVIATGGGVVENALNLENLRRSGVIICLSASPEVILARTSRDMSRPLLNSEEDRMMRIISLLERRRPLYAGADFEIDTSKSDIESTVEAVIRYYNEHA